MSSKKNSILVSAFVTVFSAVGFLLRLIIKLISKDYIIFYYKCIKKALSLNNIAKIIFIYFAAVFWVIILNFDLPKSLTGPTISLYTTERIGEKLLYERIKVAAKNNGWNVVSACFEEQMLNSDIFHNVYYTAASILNLIYRPKFNLAVTHYVNLLPYGHNMVYLNVPNEMIINVDSKFKDRYPNLTGYDTYIDLYSVTNGTNPLLLETLKKLGKYNASVIPMYLAQNKTDFERAKIDGKALIVGTIWGCNRSSLRVKSALKKLADNNLLVAFGTEYAFGFLGDSYKGLIEEFIRGDDAYKNLFAAQQKYGIALILHNLEHMLAGMPTSRIAESISAGALVISDRNPFIEKYFGNNVLYFNAFADTETIFNEIKSHIEWIISHEEEVLNMTHSAHNILMSNFALENQLKILFNKIGIGQ